MGVESRGGVPVGQCDVVDAAHLGEIASRIGDAVVIAETVCSVVLETEHISWRFIDNQVIIEIQMRPIAD